MWIELEMSDVETGEMAMNLKSRGITSGIGQGLVPGKHRNIVIILLYDRTRII